MPAATPRAQTASRTWSIRAPGMWLGSLRSFLAWAWTSHRLFAIVLIPAVLLRIDTEIGYRWQVYFNDSFEYVQNTVKFDLDPTRVSGYSVFLKILQPFHSYALITILQHLMGLGVGIMIYALARHRFGANAVLASLAAVTVLYDGFEIQLEHLILSDVPFLFVLMLATTLLLWDGQPPSLQRSIWIGVMLGIAADLRSVGLPLLAVFAVYMIIQRVSWRRIAVCIVVCVLPVFAYAGLFDLEHGQFAMTDSTGVFLYSRVMTFADCAKMQPLPADELFLCETLPPAQRPREFPFAQDYIWTAPTPLKRGFPNIFSPAPNELAKDFAIRAVEAQPLDYLRAILGDTWRVFGWKRIVFPNAATYEEYVFQHRAMPIPSWDNTQSGRYTTYVAAYAQGTPLTHVTEPFAGYMRLYQRHIYLPGTIYGLVLLAGASGIVLAWRRFGGEALLPWTLSFVMIVIPAATAEFDYRYVLPAVPFGCLAVVMAFAPGTAGGALVRRLARRLAGWRNSGAVANGAVANGAAAAEASHDERYLAPDGA